MATLKADLKTAQDTPNARQRLDANLTNQEFRRFVATYVTTGAEVANDTIDFFDIPTGGYFLPDESKVVSDGTGGTTVTLSKIGDGIVDNRYSTTAVALTAAGIVSLTPLQPNLTTPFKVTAGAGQSIRGTLAGTFPMTAGKKITMLGKYTLP